MTDDSTLAVIRKHLRIRGVDTHDPIVDAIAGAFAELHPEVALLADATVLRLEPDDIVVLTFPDRITEADAVIVLTQMKTRFPDNECVLVEGGNLAIVRPTTEQKEPTA